MKKRGRPKTTVKPVEVEPPTQDESQEVPEAKSDSKAKAAPSKRGRKPGKKVETGGAGAVVPPELISEEVRRLECFFLNFSQKYLFFRKFPSRSQNLRRKEVDPRKSKLELKLSCCQAKIPLNYMYCNIFYSYKTREKR